MVRKRNLSDLLRDEAESLDASAEDAPAAEQTIDISAEVAEESAIEPARRAHSPTKADLQAIVTDLTVELEAMRDREQQLQSQISELEAKLNAQQAQQAQIDQLQIQLQQQADQSAQLAQVQQRLEAEQAQTVQLKTELEEAKQLILKLSAANSKPEAKPAARPAPAPLPQRASLQAKPLPERSTPQRTSAIQPARPIVPPRPVMPTRPIASNTIPIMSSENDTRLSDADIGWVD